MAVTQSGYQKVLGEYIAPFVKSQGKERLSKAAWDKPKSLLASLLLLFLPRLDIRMMP